MTRNIKSLVGYYWWRNRKS